MQLNYTLARAVERCVPHDFQLEIQDCHQKIFWRSQLILIYTVCHSVWEFTSTVWIKEPDWLTIISECGILIYSAWQGLNAFDKYGWELRGLGAPDRFSTIFLKRERIFVTSWLRSWLPSIFSKGSTLKRKNLLPLTMEAKSSFVALLSKVQ